MYITFYLCNSKIFFGAVIFVYLEHFTMSSYFFILVKNFKLKQKNPYALNYVIQFINSSFLFPV